MATEANDDNSFLTDEIASALHDQWRAPHLLPDGTYEPHWKDDGNGGQVDIANTDFAHLPAHYQADTRASAVSAVNALEQAEKLGQVDEQGEPHVDFMSNIIHNDWLKRDGSTASAVDQKPYAELPDEEKEKDRNFARTAINRRKQLGGDKVKADSKGSPVKNKSAKEKEAERKRGRGGKGDRVAKGAGKAAGGAVAKKAGAGASPQAAIASGAGDAAVALKNKDGMGAVDAGVKTGAVAAATAYGGTIGGAVAGKVLETKIGRKLTRFVSFGVVGALIMGMLSILIPILVVLAIFGTILGGSARNSAMYDPAQVTAVTDPAIVKSIDALTKAVIAKGLDENTVVLGTLDILVNQSSDPAFANATSGVYSESAFLAHLDASQSTRGSLPPWDILPTLEPQFGLTSSDYALMYETAYVTVRDFMIANPGYAIKLGVINNPAKNWTTELTAFVGTDIPTDTSNSSSGALDPSGNLIDPGIIVNSPFKDGGALPSKYYFNRPFAVSLLMSSGIACGPDAPHCDGLCLTLAEYVYGYNGGYATAVDQWNAMVKDGYATKAGTPGALEPPLGALLYWNSGVEGHVAVYLGGGVVISNWDTGDGLGVNIRSVDAYRAFTRGQHWPYLGWSYPEFPRSYNIHNAGSTPGGRNH